jgi:hypothetical protein
MIHNLNSATTNLQNQKNFPSRFNIPEENLKIVHSIVKRLSRIVAHCCIYHKEAFLEFEEDAYLGKRFFTFLQRFNIIESIPPNCVIKE